MSNNELNRYIAEAEAQRREIKDHADEYMRKKHEYEMRNSAYSHIEDFMTPEEQSLAGDFLGRVREHGLLLSRENIGLSADEGWPIGITPLNNLGLDKGAYTYGPIVYLTDDSKLKIWLVSNMPPVRSRVSGIVQGFRPVWGKKVITGYYHNTNNGETYAEHGVRPAPLGEVLADFILNS